MGRVVRITDVDFEEEVLKSDVPVLVDFWASWCPPCKMVEPVIEELAEEYDGQIKVCKLHVDQNPKTASMYQIKGVPTFVLFLLGNIVQQRTGSQSKDQLRRMLSEAL